MNLNDAQAYFAASVDPAGDSAAGTFMRQGEYWTLAYGGRMILLRDSKGLNYLAALLGRPGEKVSVAALIAERDNGASCDDAALERARSAVTKRIRDAMQKIEKNHPSLGRHLGARVKTGYDCIYSPDPDQPVFWQL
jgi:hypothetical protein